MPNQRGVSLILYRLEDAEGTKIVVDGVGVSERFLIIRVGLEVGRPERVSREPEGISELLFLRLAFGAGVGCERPYTELEIKPA